MIKNTKHIPNASLVSLLSDAQFTLSIIVVVVYANMYILSDNGVQTVQPGVQWIILCK